jgi:hypothetical protein
VAIAAEPVVASAAAASNSVAVAAPEAPTKSTANAARVLRRMLVRPSGDLEMEFGTGTPLKPARPADAQQKPTSSSSSSIAQPNFEAESVINAPHEIIASQLRQAQSQAVTGPSSSASSRLPMPDASMWERAAAQAGPLPKPAAPRASFAAASETSATGRWAENSLNDMASKARTRSTAPSSTRSPKRATAPSSAPSIDAAAVIAAAQRALQEDEAAGRPTDRELALAALKAAQTLQMQQRGNSTRSLSTPPVISAPAASHALPVPQSNNFASVSSGIAMRPQQPSSAADVAPSVYSHNPLNKPSRPPRPGQPSEGVIVNAAAPLSKDQRFAASAPLARASAFTSSAPAPASYPSVSTPVAHHQRKYSLVTPQMHGDAHGSEGRSSWVVLEPATITTSIRAMGRIQDDNNN